MAEPDSIMLSRLKADPDQLSNIYLKHKEYCLNFMRRMISFSENDELEDIYQDAVIVLYEKVLSGDFELTSSIQTYLNAICRNQLLRRNTLSQRQIVYNEYLKDDSEDESYRYNQTVNDWLNDESDVNSERLSAILKSLETIKDAKGHCYEILTWFYYHNKTMHQIASQFGFSNADSAKSQKAKCQDKLKKMSFKALNRIV